MLIRSLVHDRISFFCPACKEPHVVSLSPNGGWKYTAGESGKPTIEPKVTHMKPATELGKPHGGICHCTVTDGQISFDPKSSHDLAGQTVELPEFPEG